jgi:hypothetical protein
VSGPSAPEFVVEPLGEQERLSFSCGVPELDRYLQVQARQDARRKVAAPFVLVDREGRVAGYYSLSSYAIHLHELPEEIARKLPKYPLLPATLLGRSAIGTAHRGQKLGRLQLMDALFRSWRNSAQVASVGVVAEALDEPARDFYLHHEFMPIAGHRRKVFIAMRTIERAFR